MGMLQSDRHTGRKTRQEIVLVHADTLNITIIHFPYHF